MLIHEGPSRTDRIDERLAWTFAAIAGALNAAGFYAFGAYSANMTGNVSSLADHLGLGDARMALYGLLLVVAFVGGAIVATLLVGVGRARGLAGVYAYAVLAEAMLLTLLACAAPWLPDGPREAALSLGLSFLLGLQNATITQITNARVRTTHVTGTVTDLGIGLAHLLEGHPGTDRAKLRLHLVTVAAFLAGGIAGVFVFKAVGIALLFGAAGLLAAMALPGIQTARRSRPAAGAPRPS
jgi:uncharacterized membrane protein YoaK (UPF0700 family)